VNSDFSVSVVIPAFNAASTIRRAIQSALDQTIPPLEVLVVADGPDEALAELIASHFGSSVRYIEVEHGGHCRARNIGRRAAIGNWVGHLDADDVWAPTKLERQSDVARTLPQVMVIHTAFEMFGMRTALAPTRSEMHSEGADVVQMILRRHVKLSTALVRSDSPLGFPEWARFGGDIIFFADCVRHGMPMELVAEVLVRAEQHNAQHTRQRGTILFEHHENRVRWLREVRSDVGDLVYFQAMGAMIEQMLWLSHLAERDENYLESARGFEISARLAGEIKAERQNKVYP
jgi:glycosyltransferase involved in cell wall biosynthesis